ncbi:acyltransferase [Methylomonas sp. MED-D]|uniref:acyltransferase n=1 Tax=unclassified Methylomonas TaxID=2608980 RepID=UPI0028A3FBC9|nr:acyltransferase [Methylomonas sp. MV1]MDT4330077.1 acyltransferase [Methylomonas sp. MV1]
MNILFKVAGKLRYWYWQISARMLARVHGVVLGRGCKFYGMPIFSIAKDSKIIIGDRVVFCSDSRFTALGVNHPVILRTLQPGAVLMIGDDCGLSGTSICAAKYVSIGKRALLGANVSIFDTDFHAKASDNRRYCKDPVKIAVKPVEISDDVFIGANSIIVKGVSIAANSIVGAGAVVVRDIAQSKIYAGNPAKEVGNVD